MTDSDGSYVLNNFNVDKIIKYWIFLLPTNNIICKKNNILCNITFNLLINSMSVALKSILADLSLLFYKVVAVK